MASGIESSDRQSELLQVGDLAKTEIGVVGAVGDLRDGKELDERGHCRREGRVRGVVMKPSKFAFDPRRREFLQVRPRTVKRVDPPSHHRNRVADVVVDKYAWHK